MSHPRESRDADGASGTDCEQEVIAQWFSASDVVNEGVTASRGRGVRTAKDCGQRQWQTPDPHSASSTNRVEYCSVRMSVARTAPRAVETDACTDRLSRESGLPAPPAACVALAAPQCPSAIGHRFGVTAPTATYRRGLPRRRGTDAPHRLWIGVLRGREVSGSTRGAGTAVTAGEVPQLKVVSGRHSDRRKRPVRSGAPWLTRALQYHPGPPVSSRSSRSTRQVSPYVLRWGGAGEAAP